MFTQIDEEFLLSSGYKYYCFISWPHTGNRELTECALRLKEEIENGLRSIVAEPKVFLDEKMLKGGDAWQRVIKKALCRSIAMVAICAPIYYHAAHRWCGLEWACMDLLSKKRFPGEDFTSIIPVIVRRGDKLPDTVSKKQPVDVSRVIIKGRRYYTTNEFREKVEEIITQIQNIASHLVLNKIKSDSKEFQFPVESAFSDYHVQIQSLPFRDQSL